MPSRQVIIREAVLAVTMGGSAFSDALLGTVVEASWRLNDSGLLDDALYLQ